MNFQNFVKNYILIKEYTPPCVTRTPALPLDHYFYFYALTFLPSYITFNENPANQPLTSWPPRLPRQRAPLADLEFIKVLLISHLTPLMLLIFALRKWPYFQIFDLCCVSKSSFCLTLPTPTVNSQNTAWPKKSHHHVGVHFNNIF